MMTPPAPSSPRCLPEAGGQTSGQLRVALRRAVIAADPEGAEQRRKDAQRHAKVSLYPDPDADTATLAGARLPAVHAAAAMARLTAIARAMKAAGMGGGLDYLRAIAYIGLLLGTLPLVPPPAGDPGPPGPTRPRPRRRRPPRRPVPAAPDPAPAAPVPAAVVPPTPAPDRPATLATATLAPAARTPARAPAAAAPADRAPPGMMTTSQTTTATPGRTCRCRPTRTRPMPRPTIRAASTTTPTTTGRRAVRP